MELTVGELRKQLAACTVTPIEDYVVRAPIWYEQTGPKNHREPLIVDHEERVVYLLGIAGDPDEDGLDEAYSLIQNGRKIMGSVRVASISAAVSLFFAGVALAAAVWPRFHH